MKAIEVDWSLENYQKYVVEDKTHELIIEGDPARIICTDRLIRGKKHIVALIIRKADADRWDDCVTFHMDGRGVHTIKIVPIPPKSLGWVIAWKHDENSFIYCEFYTKEEQVKERARKLVRSKAYIILAIQEIYEGEFEIDLNKLIDEKANT